MNRPLLSIIIPTAGRRPDGLRRVLDSIALQKPRFPIEVLVVGDATRGPLEDAEAIAVQNRAMYLEHADPDSIVGHAQRQAGMAAAAGRWLHCMADDDIYTPDALLTIAAAIREQKKPYQPLLFRVNTWQAGLVWTRHQLYEGGIDAECIVTPNVPGRLGVWTKDRYNGDFDFIHQTVANFGGAVWRPEIISLCRPRAAEDWVGRMAVTA